MKNHPGNPNPNYKANYIQQRKLVDNLVTSVESSYFWNMILQNQNCPKKLWRTLDSFLVAAFLSHSKVLIHLLIWLLHFSTFLTAKLPNCTVLFHELAITLTLLYLQVCLSLHYCLRLFLLLPKRYTILYYLPQTNLVLWILFHLVTEILY